MSHHRGDRVAKMRAQAMEREDAQAQEREARMAVGQSAQPVVLVCVACGFRNDLPAGSVPKTQCGRCGLTITATQRGGPRPVVNR